VHSDAADLPEKQELHKQTAIQLQAEAFCVTVSAYLASHASKRAQWRLPDLSADLSLALQALAVVQQVLCSKIAI
jgi:hypothetical protein